MEELVKKFIHSGSGFGDGSGSGDGSGFGSGYGYGSGYGSGNGYGSGDGYGIKKYNKDTVYLIDGVQTIITSIIRNIAKGYILQGDLTLTPCYVAKGDEFFAHGKTSREALNSLTEKILDNKPIEERIEAFVFEFPSLEEKYAAKTLYKWHHILTGSCDVGRRSFCEDHGIDLENDTFSVVEFIELTINSYGGDVIRELKNTLKKISCQ